jgi:hypothetical protein
MMTSSGLVQRNVKKYILCFQKHMFSCEYSVFPQKCVWLQICTELSAPPAPFHSDGCALRAQCLTILLDPVNCSAKCKMIL